jgi:hypothetical protein
MYSVHLFAQPSIAGENRKDKTMADRGPVKTVYRITYPNGKIYVGLDLTGTTLYFGSSSIKAQIAAELSAEQRRDFTLRKEILWESEEASDAEARAMEVRLIQELHANDPAVGYNRWPRRRIL